MIRLVPFTVDDAAAVLGGRRAVGWADGYPTVGDIEMATRLDAGTKPEVTDDFPWSVWTVVQSDARGDLVVGGAGFHDTPDACNTVEIGYGIAAECRGQGIATEAVLLLVELARRHGAGRVVAGTDADNTPSQRVLQKAGFTRTDDEDGEWRWALALAT